MKNGTKKYSNSKFQRLKIEVKSVRKKTKQNVNIPNLGLLQEKTKPRQNENDEKKMLNARLFVRCHACVPGPVPVAVVFKEKLTNRKRRKNIATLFANVKWKE